MNRYKTVLILALVLFVPAQLLATKKWAQRTKKRCTYCHITVAADAPLNPLGRSYRENGHSFAVRGATLEKSASKGPLTESEQKLLWRRYLLKGRRLFTLDKIGHSKISCASCHKEPPHQHNLVGVWNRYPRYHAGLHRMADLEDAVNFCVTERMKGSPLRPGTKSSLAMQVYLKSLR